MSAAHRLLRIYADTSVIGGCEDEEFAEESRRFFDRVRRGQIRLLLSELVVAELTDAPAKVRSVLETIPAKALEQVAVTEEVLALRDAYVEARIVGRRWLDDAGHVAAATVAAADAIVSWNFQHIVRLSKMKAYNEVNRIKGYGPLTIITPKEVGFDGPEGDEEGV